MKYSLSAVLATERDTLRHCDPCDPRIRDLNLEILFRQTRPKRCVTRRLHKTSKERAQLTFTDGEVQSAINKAKSSKSIGPDGISMLMLKQLGRRE